MARPRLDPNSTRRPAASNRWLFILAGVVIVLIVAAIAALFAVVPGDPAPVDEAVGDVEVQAYEEPLPAP